MLVRYLTGWCPLAGGAFTGLLLYSSTLASAPADTVTLDVTSNPIWVENLSPISGLMGLPPQRSAAITSGWQFASHLAIASHWVVDASANETLAFDGETTRWSFDASYGFNDRWSIQVTLPFVQQDAGFLDSTINGWHDIFGMTDGGRAAAPDNQFAYRYQSPDLTIDQRFERRGLGDARVELQQAFYRQADQVAAVVMGYKAASGDDRDWLGSGAADIYGALRFSGAQRSSLPLTWHGQIGYTRAGSSDLVAPLQERNLWFAGIGLDWRIAPRWSVLAQYDAHGAVMNSDIEAIGSTAGILSFAARWRADAHWALDLGFTEDIPVESSPDIIFQATLRWRP